MDPRLRCAVDASLGWYDDLCALHGVGSALADGVWSALAPPPPLHSAAFTVEPGVSAEHVLERVADGPRGAVKDSFATVDLGAAGWDLLFAASWVHRPPAPARAGGWSAVTDEQGLAAWTAGHGTADVLLPGLLRSAHFRVLGRLDGDGVTAGAVARLGSGVVELSDVHGEVDWDELAAAVAAVFPDRPLVGYERDDDLAAAVAGGFSPVGDLRVWLPPRRVSHARCALGRRRGLRRRQLLDLQLAVGVLPAQHLLVELADAGLRHRLDVGPPLGQPPRGDLARQVRAQLLRRAPARPVAAPRRRAAARPSARRARATTAASNTAGCPMSVPSSSTELIHSPPDLMTSLLRSVICR